MTVKIIRAAMACFMLFSFIAANVGMRSCSYHQGYEQAKKDLQDEFVIKQRAMTQLPYQRKEK